MKIIGSYVSPYVRKVLACVHLKGLDYEIDPITAFYGDEEFERLSPLRRIPVLIHEDLVLSDSSAICAYLDESWPEPPLLPPSPKERARARWLEEYADTRLGDVFIWGLFYPKIVHPMIWGEPGDQERIERTRADDVPREMDYLEGQLPDSGFLFGEEIGLADISIATFFRNAAYAGFEPDPPAGRGWRASSGARSPTAASKPSCPSKTSSEAPIPRAAARHCWRPERRSLRRRWGRGSRARV
ncbi:MAG TPA: glutathione S-transferase family protein [Allosphingosinicella sp.]|nr:glutathione S-transferase family protein [Allosphingosinicella sp.]